MSGRERGYALVADDDADVRDTLTQLLTEAGFRVATAADGRGALGRVEAEEFDLVVSDITMPDTDGLQLLRAIRERDLDLPVLLVTGNPSVETAAQAVEHGALRYLVKPVDPPALIKAVEQGVRLRRLARLKREALLHLGLDDRLVGDRAGLEARFDRALRTLRVAYQPIVHAAKGSTYGHEALCRTDEPSLPHPVALFDAAARLGKVQQLGRAVRRTVASAMTNGGLSGSVFVNLHALELDDDDLVSPDAPLSRDARRVVLEITERVPLDRIQRLPSRVRDLRRLGFGLAVDDLGAGYAGLSSFTVLAPDVVKLDMALVRGLDRDPLKRKLVRSMVSLCKELGILVVAEGVETPDERRALVAEGCDLLQGNLLGRPDGQPPS